MATYYVGAGGNNSNAGTSWATRWLTVAKALGGTGIGSGDTLYIAPGTYREALITISLSSSPTVDTFIIGDTDGSHTSGTAGEVIISSYTTSDKAAPSTSNNLINIQSGKNYLKFKNITFIGTANSNQNASCIEMNNTSLTNVEFSDCTFSRAWGTGTSQTLVRYSTGVASMNLVFSRCRFIGLLNSQSGASIQIGLARAAADYDADIQINNCIFINFNTAVRVSSSGAGVGFGGGVRVRGCTFIGTGTAVATSDANLSTSVPAIQVNGCLFIGANVGISANVSGQITEDYNFFNVLTARTNVTAGTGSQTNYAGLVHWGQEILWGSYRPVLSPTVDSPILGFGDGTGVGSTDMTGRARPEGGYTLKAAGAHERHDTAALDYSVYDAATPSLRITGPGSQRINVPVDATPTTITVKAYADTSHGSTAPPQVKLVENMTIGISSQTVTMTANTGQWNTITLGPFTPTSKGQATVELISRSAATPGNAYFDTLTIS